MREEAVDQAGTWLAELVAQATRDQQPIWLTENGQHVAAIVDAASLRRLHRLVHELDAGDGEPSAEADKEDLGL